MQPLYEYVCHIKGHRNSKGELAEWVIKSHETGKILSSHKSEQKAKEHLQQMHIFQEAADGSQAEDFHTLINRYATATASIINKFLEKYELSIEVVDTEEGKDFFEETGAIAVRLASLQDDVHVAPVAINEELISRYYYDEWDEDNTILNECVSDTLWHEACHHICLYISDTLDVDIMDNDSEEDIVENYALYMTSKTMGIHKEFSADLVDKFSGAFAILDAMNNGAFDKESLKEMMKFLDPSVDSENDLVDILEDIGLTESDSKSHVCAHCGWDGDGNLTEYNGRLLCPSCLKEFQRLDANRDANGYIKYDNITKRSDGFNPEGYKLIGESTDGTDMDNRVKIFMEGVSQLGLSKNQVDAIGKITKVCLEGSFGQTQEPDDDDIGFVYVSRHGHSALSRLPKMRYTDFLKQHDNLASHVDVGPIKKYRMPLIDTEENQAQYVNYDSIPEDTNGNAWGFEYGRKSGFEYISEKYIWLPSDAFDTPVPLEKEGPDVGCIGEMSSNSRENILGIRRDKTYDDFLNGYKKARDLATREPDEFKVSKLQRYSTPEFNPLSVKVNHMSFDSIKPDENGNVLGYEEYHRPGHPFQVVTKILWLPANTDEPADETLSDDDVYSALYPDEAPTYGGRVRTSEEEYDSDNPNDTDDDIFYEGDGRVNELDPDEELEF